MTLTPRKQWGRWPWVERWCWPLVHPIRWYRIRRYIRAIPGMRPYDLKDRILRWSIEMQFEHRDKEEGPRWPYTNV